MPPLAGERWWRQPPKGGSPSPARAVVKVLIYDGAEGAVPPQWNGTSYLPRAEPSTRPGGVSRSRTEPLAPRAKGPAASSTLTPVRACQPSGILESTAQVPVPIPTAPKALEPSSPSGLVHRACQPSGIQLPADSSHKLMVSLTPKALEPPLHFFPYLWYIGSDIFNSLQGREKVHGWNWQSEPGWWKRVREFHGSASLS